jgi:hypothetical protein
VGHRLHNAGKPSDFSINAYARNNYRTPFGEGLAAPPNIILIIGTNVKQRHQARRRDQFP